ncbi:MAG: SDR family NAD(P)-dependent oxidoreductase [Nannocystaceae bacterium]|nr:SDR family oxidoreductase [bacterium]
MGGTHVGFKVLVTGSASGIGLAITDRLAKAGAAVFATDADGEALRAVAEDHGWPGDRVHTAELDVRESSRWDAAQKAAIGAMDGLDTLINVAGVIHPAWIHELDLEQAQLQVDVNLMGVLRGMRATTAGFVERRRGHVINVASMAALAPIEGIAVYSATKYAVRSLSLAASNELRRKGVAVTVICPDAVRTPMLDRQEAFEQADLVFSGSRELSPQEVADAVLDAMHDRPLEVYLPRHRGWLARLADLFPASATTISDLARRRGHRRRTELLDRVASVAKPQKR